MISGIWRTVVAGGVGGISLWATVYPADVIKSRNQVSPLLRNLVSTSEQVKTFIEF